MTRDPLAAAPEGALSLDRFGRQPWRKQPPATAALLLLEALDLERARRMSLRAQQAARRARSRRHFAYWRAVGDALAHGAASPGA